MTQPATRARTLTIDMAIPALAMGAAAGGAFTGLFFAIAGWTSALPTIFLFLLGSAYGSLVHFVGLSLLAWPVWALLHRRGYRRLWHAAVVGMILEPGGVFLAGLAISAITASKASSPTDALQGAAWSILIFGMLGAIVSSVVWWTAYVWRSRP